MDTMAAFAMAQANYGAEHKVFDWNEAARLIKKLKPASAVAGLKDDLEWTSGTIYENGHPVYDSYTYLSSNWATPILILEFENGNTKEFSCYVMASTTKWDANTKWPESSLKILTDDQESR